MIYTAVQWIVKLTLKLYFKKIHTSNLDKIPKDRPVILVPNHPGAFMDPSLIATLLPQKLTFISRGESFSNALKCWFFAKLNMVPIYRKEFSPNEIHKNISLIQAYQNILSQNRTIVIFPEDIKRSAGKRLRKIKTGAARIILGYENDPASQKDLCVIPIGLNYSNPHEFRSEVFVNVGDPIDCEKFRAINKTDNQSAVQLLTTEIELSLKRLTLSTDTTDESILPKVEQLYQSELMKEANIKGEEVNAVFDLRKKMANAVNYFNKNNPQWFHQIEVRLNHYFETLSKYHIPDQYLQEAYHLVNLNLLTLLIGSPFFLYGWINHLPAMKLTQFIVNKFTRRDDFYGAMTFSMAILCFPACYLIQLLLAWVYLPNANIAILYILSLPLSGLFLIHYQPYLKAKIEVFFFNLRKRKNAALINQLQVQRNQLLQSIRSVRENYFID